MIFSFSVHTEMATWEEVIQVPLRHKGHISGHNGGTQAGIEADKCLTLGSSISKPFNLIDKFELN